MDSIGSCIRDGHMDDVSLTYKLPKVNEDSSFYIRSHYKNNVFDSHTFDHDNIVDNYSAYDMNKSLGLNTVGRDDLSVYSNQMISLGRDMVSEGGQREDKWTDYHVFDERLQSTTASDSGSIRRNNIRNLTLRTMDNNDRRTIRIRNLDKSVSPRDVELVLQRILPCINNSIVATFNHYNQGAIYIEFATTEDAALVVQFFKARNFPLGNECVVEWSHKEEVISAEDTILKDDIKILSININHVLQVMTLHDLYYMLREYAVVKKIVLCNTVGITMSTLVEFESSKDAFIAFRMFNNQNLLHGKCLIQINPSKVSRLDVRMNNHKQWDFSVENCEPASSTKSSVEVLKSLKHKLQDSFKATTEGNLIKTTTALFMRVLPPEGLEAVYRNPDIRRLMKELRLDDLLLANPCVTSVVRIKGFGKNVNSSVLFNVFSTCGSILSLKLLQSVESMALIQYTDPIFAVLASLYLNKMPLLDNERKVKVELSHNKEVFSGSDYCSYTYQDQRYQSRDEDKYLRSACKPTTAIWIANIRLTNSNLDTKTLMGSHGLHPLSCTVNKIHGDITSARVQFNNICEAVKAVAYMHDLGVEGGRLKVSFSRVKQ